MQKTGSLQTEFYSNQPPENSWHPAIRCLLYQIIGEYIIFYTSQKKSHYTRKNERTYFSNFYEYCSSVGLHYCDQITPALLERYRISLLAKVAPATVNRQFNTLKHMFSILHKNDLIRKNPFSLIKRLKEPKPKINLWTARDFIRCRRALDQRHANLLTFLWYSGARLIEAVNLMWTDIDWDRKEIILRSEKINGASRVITLTSKIDKLLHSNAFRGVYVFGEGSKFTSDRFGKVVRKAVLNFCQNKDLTVKEIRHTYCTRGHEKELQDSTIQELMGHASYRTTQKYRHLSRKHLNKAAEKM